MAVARQRTKVQGRAKQAKVWGEEGIIVLSKSEMAKRRTYASESTPMVPMTKIPGNEFTSPTCTHNMQFAVQQHNAHARSRLADKCTHVDANNCMGNKKQKKRIMQAKT